MKKIILFALLFPVLVLSQKMNDSLVIKQNQVKIEELNENFKNLQAKYEYQVKINDQTLSSISNQIGATSYNLSIFAFLFGVLAIGLGVYITWVERKIVKIREQNESLLSKTLLVKEEVVLINNKIQSDIYGLFLKIKREETVHILNRLEKIPKDISNLAQSLLSRELQKEDFSSLKTAFLKLDNNGDYKGHYKLLFFQHFFDLSIKDEIISKELEGWYSRAIRSAFENDIIKSTEDFMSAILDLGYQKKSREINEFIRGISQSVHKDFETIYQVIIRSIINRDDQFKFFNLINDNKESRIGKAEYGKHLLQHYKDTKLSDSEILVKEKTEKIFEEFDKEEKAKKEVEEKRKALVVEKARKIEEVKKAQNSK